ncbi:major vault protein, putative [Bodo saltans]|uniref:Major vault protein n=1 Tax=Bodo saltans TaxID=75058 RepID=A0A0S4JL46_BODSA|nr:major vault protein, putative [Bodo saltans]|eukprot:CUG92246.1 major vault protein, putative [Bodo saltans]
MSDVIRLKQHQYIHVLDNNTNVTTLHVGPKVFTRQDHEKVLFAPKACVQIPPRSYCRIRNPALRAADGSAEKDAYGQVKLRIGDEEIRFEQEPFPLMPGEVLMEANNDPAIKKLAVIPSNTALKLIATRDFTDSVGVAHVAGDEWLFEGPDTYIPRVEVDVLETIKAQVIRPNTALRLRAKKRFNDRTKVGREVGEEWLVKSEGAYLPTVEEEVVGFVNAKVLTDKDAIHVEALRSFTDIFGKKRRAGEQWLVTNKSAATHIPDVYEKILADIKVTTLNNRQYCVVLDPFDQAAGRNSVGNKEIRRGEVSFFLHPGERLRNGIENVLVLGKDEALLLKAVEAFDDATNKGARKPGEKWMIYGPAEYVPPVQVELLERRQAIALDKNEGVYVRDETTGEVRAVVGQAYMLKENETLWDKELPPIVEDLLLRPNGMKHTLKDDAAAPKGPARIKNRVVRFNVPHNAAVQIFDYKKKAPRIVFGPDLVMLAPDEQFTVLSLSGDKPKIPNVVKSIQLMLGPDFSSDTIIVETSDHARLALKLSYNWHFEVDRTSETAKAKIFAVPDFVGDFCKAIASRVRGAVAAEDFDSFHRNSAKIIRAAVFGINEQGKVGKSFKFPANGLVVTNIDIQAVEPTDSKTRDSLQKSVQLAIEITTKSQEATARHDNERKDQEAKGKLERQKLLDKIEAERAKTEWLELQAQSEAIQASGQAVAEAKARSEAAIIEADSELKQAQLRAQAFKISAESELKQLKSKQNAEVEYIRRNNELELKKARELAEIEATKLAQIMEAIGTDTVIAIAQAGPEMQAKLLAGLGLKGYLITDGNSPINLFNAAQGMIGVPPPQ